MTVVSARRPRRWAAQWTGLFLVAPAVVLLTIFVVWPLVYAMFLSFFNWSFYIDSVFVGFRNYINVLSDPVFIQSIARGLQFCLMVVPTILIVAFLFASFVKTLSRRLSTLLKISIYVPTVISSVIASSIFVLIYAYQGGIANWALGLVGVPGQAWLSSTDLALTAIAVPAVWISLGLASLIMLAGLLDIPASYYEAAQLEGANWFQQTRYVTIPLLRNIIVYLLVTNFALAIQQYELPLIMTDGGPLNSTLLPNLYIFNEFRSEAFTGPSIAASIILFIVMGSVSAVLFRLVRSEKAIDG